MLCGSAIKAKATALVLLHYPNARSVPVRPVGDGQHCAPQAGERMLCHNKWATTTAALPATTLQRKADFYILNSAVLHFKFLSTRLQVGWGHFKPKVKGACKCNAPLPHKTKALSPLNNKQDQRSAVRSSGKQKKHDPFPQRPRRIIIPISEVWKDRRTFRCHAAVGDGCLV